MRILLFFIPTFCFAATVLIDPGHGGHEHGATNSHAAEKDLALIVSKRIKKILSKEHTVYLTRSFDTEVSLEQRANMADTVKADIFISVHFNSTTSSKHSGFETYFLSNKKNKAIEKVEKIENNGMAPDDMIVNQILIDLVIERTTKSSKRLAGLVHSKVSKSLKKSFKMKDRGIKGGLFYVLALSKRPSILLEGGFMSNPSELKKIRSQDYIDRYSKAISSGISEYLSSLPAKNLPIF